MKDRLIFFCFDFLTEIVDDSKILPSDLFSQDFFRESFVNKLTLLHFGYPNFDDLPIPCLPIISKKFQKTPVTVWCFKPHCWISFITKKIFDKIFLHH